MSSTGVTAVLAPMPSELAPVVRALSLTRKNEDGKSVYTGSAGGGDVLAIRIGAGMTQAAEATDWLLDRYDVGCVVVVGVCGGIDDGVAIGDLVVPEKVLNGDTGDEFAPTTPAGLTAHGTLRTSDHFFVDLEEFERLRARGIVALDMETAGVAEVCERRGRPWSVIRAYSDRPGDGLVDDTVFGLMRPDGTPNLPAVARLLVRRPWEIRRLVRVGRDASKAARSAARAVAAAIAAE